tara:strand:+ start:1042 stop:1737 length:696 start_codon:yes stop_codon:yes gene_type:complete
MKIGGIQKTTLIDFPGKIAATVFLSGCNFRCPWCYSSELVLPEKIKNHPEVSEKEFTTFLKEKQGLLEGIAICGGEPCLNNDLPKFIKKIRKYGYEVKLDTNGSNPKMLGQLIDDKLIDYVAMDIKAPKEKYSKAIGKNVSLSNIEKSIKLLKQGKVDYEFRTTIVPAFHKEKDIFKMARWLWGADKYYLQNFRPEKTIDPKLETVRSYSEEYLLDIVKKISPLFDICELR